MNINKALALLTIILMAIIFNTAVQAKEITTVPIDQIESYTNKAVINIEKEDPISTIVLMGTILTIALGLATTIYVELSSIGEERTLLRRVLNYFGPITAGLVFLSSALIIF